MTNEQFNKLIKCIVGIARLFIWYVSDNFYDDKNTEYLRELENECVIRYNKE